MLGSRSDLAEWQEDLERRIKALAGEGPYLKFSPNLRKPGLQNEPTSHLSYMLYSPAH